MKKILIISRGFPPSTSPAAFRAKTLFELLENHNFQTFVLTSIENPTDSKNEDRILRVPYPSHRVYRLFYYFEQMFSIGSGFLWYFHCKNKYEEIKKLDIDLIISTSPSHVTHIIASDLSEYLDCKWIAEFRDLWIGNPYSWYLLPFFKNIESKIEKKTLNNADALTTVYLEGKRILENRYPEKNITLVRNGYDSTLKECFEKEKPSNQFTISYTGSFYFDNPNINRSPFHFLKAIQKIHKKNLISKNKITINFIGLEGSQKRTVLDMIDNLNIPSDMINIKGRVSHEKALELSAKSDINLLIEETDALTRKFFDYLMVKRPILALVPSSSPIRDIIDETKSGYCVCQEKTEKIVEFILERYNNRYSCDKFEFDIEEYSEQKQMEKMAHLIEDILDE